MLAQRHLKKPKTLKAFQEGESETSLFGLILFISKNIKYEEQEEQGGEAGLFGRRPFSQIKTDVSD